MAFFLDSLDPVGKKSAGKLVRLGAKLIAYGLREDGAVATDTSFVLVVVVRSGGRLGCVFCSLLARLFPWVLKEHKAEEESKE